LVSNIKHVGKEGAFVEFSIIVGLFCPHLNERLFKERTGESLSKKGFKVFCTTSESVFLERLNHHDVRVELYQAYNQIRLPGL
jgi:hypothetical protein